MTWIQVEFTDGSIARYEDVHSAEEGIKKRMDEAQNGSYRDHLGVVQVTDRNKERLYCNWSVKIVSDFEQAEESEDFKVAGVSDAPWTIDENELATDLHISCNEARAILNPKPELTAKLLGRMIYEELEKDEWGDIEPWWFVGVDLRPGDEDDIPEECSTDESEDVLQVLEKVVEKIRKTSK